MKKNIWKPKTRRRDRGEKRDVSARREREKADILVGLVMVLTELAKQK